MKRENHCFDLLDWEKYKNPKYIYDLKNFHGDYFLIKMNIFEGFDNVLTSLSKNEFH